MRAPMNRRIVAWSGIATLFAILYAGVPFAGLAIDHAVGLFPSSGPGGDPRHPEASERTRAFPAGVRPRGRGSQRPKVNARAGRPLEMTQDPIPVPPPHTRHDIPAGLRELPQAAGHARVPF